MDFVLKLVGGGLDLLGWSETLPGWLKLSWKWLGLLALVIFASLSAISHAYRQFDPLVRRADATQRSIETLRQRDYSIEWRHGDEVLMSRSPERNETASLIQQSKVLITDAGEFHFVVMIPFEDAYWKIDSVAVFERDNRSVVSLPRLFQQPEYRRAFSASVHLVCVGLASSTSGESSPASDQRNDGLATERSERLCGIVAGALGQGAPIRYWTLPLGYYVGAPAEPGSLSERRQRSAVIVGVTTTSNDGFDVALTRVILETQLSHVNLAQYSRSLSPHLEAYDVDWESEFPLEEDPSFRGSE